LSNAFVTGRTVDWRVMRRHPQSPPGHMSDPSFPRRG
jgi:hypothetical protein